MIHLYLGNGPSIARLFEGPRLEQLFARNQELAKEAVQKLQEDDLRLLDDNAYLSALVERLDTKAPQIVTSDLVLEDLGEVDVDVSANHSFVFAPGQRRSVVGRAILVVLPFIGSRELFDHDPPGSMGTKPAGEVRGDTLVHRIEYPGTFAPDIKAIAHKFGFDVERWLAISGDAIVAQRIALASVARNALEERRARTAAAQQALASTGLKVKLSLSQGKRAIADVILRRPAPLTGIQKGSIPLTTTLSDDTYDHILAVVRAGGRLMEQSPEAFSQLDEEARRQVLRTSLNTHYVGQTAAEAFNYRGKTDILVQWEGQALFVAECKFWTGAKDFTETIDQLFRYVTWRDTKLALVIFVEEKGLSALLEKAREALQIHPQFSDMRSVPHEGELRATMTWPGDSARQVSLHCLFVHTPR